MNPLSLKKIVPSFNLLMESEFKGSNGNIVGWHTSLVDNASLPLGSGFSEDRNTARRIAIAEAIERQCFRDLIKSEDLDYFGLKGHPNTDGFACGFENDSTMMRAICEAVERWAWSQWIDYNCKIPQIESEVLISPLGKSIQHQFDKISFYLKPIKILLNNRFVEFFIGVCIAEKNNGVFPGSRVSLDKNSLWQHGLIEAYRNYNIYTSGFGRNDIICDRIKFFGKCGIRAISQIASAHKNEWKVPRIKLLAKHHEMPDGVHLWRAICDGYIDWHTGPVDRFVY